MSRMSESRAASGSAVPSSAAVAAPVAGPAAWGSRLSEPVGVATPLHSAPPPPPPPLPPPPAAHLDPRPLQVPRATLPKTDLELGRLLGRFRDGELHHHLGFARLADYAPERLGVSLRTAQELIRASFLGQTTSTEGDWLNPTGDYGIRSDEYGDGHYGARRTTPEGELRDHKGTDYRGEAGQNVVSPVDGVIGKSVGYPYGNSRYYTYVTVTATTGHKVDLYYTRPTANLMGTFVTKGTPLGTLLDLNSRYPGIMNHVHVRVRLNGKYIDPETLIKRP